VVTCGWCGSRDTDAEYVDNGVGMQQVTAAVCRHCGAVQINPYNEEEVVDLEDRERGWYASEETEDIITKDREQQTVRARDYNNGEKMLVEHEGTVHQAFKCISWADPTFQFSCGIETAVGRRPQVEAVTCFDCIAYWAKGKP